MTDRAFIADALNGVIAALTILIFIAILGGDY